MKYLFIGIVKLYRKYISPLKKPCCRFTPTCSEYALEAFYEWGTIRGLGLTIWRILRCNPFCAGGNDPVPLNKRKRKRLKQKADKTQPKKNEENS